MQKLKKYNLHGMRKIYDSTDKEKLRIKRLRKINYIRCMRIARREHFLIMAGHNDIYRCQNCLFSTSNKHSECIFCEKSNFEKLEKNSFSPELTPKVYNQFNFGEKSIKALNKLNLSTYRNN